MCCMRIAVYISGHGFGHLAQTAPVLNRIHALRPDCRFLIRCALPEAEIRARLEFGFELEAMPVDTGVVQKNAVEEDREASLKQMSQWLGSMAARIDSEIRLLRTFRPTLLLSNISPLAFPVARALAVPGIAVATLDWHTIYAHWLDAAHPILAGLAGAYGACDLLLSPPMAMDMRVFPRRQQLPLIAPFPSAAPPPFEDSGQKSALVIFGGAGQPSFDLAALAAMPDWRFLLPEAPAEAADMPGNVRTVRLDRARRPIDLMPHVDAVVCKPGYGVLAECWRTGTPIAWVERPDFPEFPVLKGWLDECFPACGMTQADFRCGNWRPALESVCSLERGFPDVTGNGAHAAADILIDIWRMGGSVATLPRQ